MNFLQVHVQVCSFIYFILMQEEFWSEMCECVLAAAIAANMFRKS